MMAHDRYARSLVCRRQISCVPAPVLAFFLPVFCALLMTVPVTAFAQSGDDLTVDVELVLAVDISWSMDRDEQILQRDGYAAAFRSKEVIDAITWGGYGRVAVTYIEWAGEASQLIVVPWTLIDSAESAALFADRLLKARQRNCAAHQLQRRCRFRPSCFSKTIIAVCGGSSTYRGMVRTMRERRSTSFATG